MQDLVKITDYKIQRLSELLAIENGDVYFNLIVKTFKFPNKDVENFLKTKAVQATKLNTATTYLVYMERSTTEIDLVGYFSLAMKMLSLKKSSLLKSSQRIISRFGYYDDDSKSYKIPAILVAQFGRNFSEESVSIPGSDLLVRSLLAQLPFLCNFRANFALSLRVRQRHKCRVNECYMDVFEAIKKIKE